MPSTLPDCVSRAVGVVAGREDLGGHPLVGVGRPGRARVASPEDLGQAPVHHLDLAEGPDHDVLRLEVAVDDAAGVGVGDGLADLLEHGEEPAAVGARVRPLGERGRRGSAP